MICKPYQLFSQSSALTADSDNIQTLSVVHIVGENAYYPRSPIWAYLSTSEPGPIWIYLGLSGYIWAYLGISGPNWVYPGLSGHISAYLSIS